MCKVFTLLIFSGVSREISQGPKCTSQIWTCAVIGLRFSHTIQETFVGVDCVTSQDNVCGGGYWNYFFPLSLNWGFGYAPLVFLGVPPYLIFSSGFSLASASRSLCIKNWILCSYFFWYSTSLRSPFICACCNPRPSSPIMRSCSLLRT